MRVDLINCNEAVLKWKYKTLQRWNYDDMYNTYNTLTVTRNQYLIFNIMLQV